MTDAETITRRELAACYRMLDHYGMTDLVSTHASARVPGSETILINRYGLLFSEVTASNLICMSDDDGINPAGQLIHSAIQFYNRIGYHDYEGVALESAEKLTLANDLGSHHAMILRNHGLLTAGRTIAEAFTLMVNLERACQIQVRALAGGVTLVPIAEPIRELAASQHDGFAGMEVGTPEWAAMMRLVRKIAPDFAD